MNDDQILLLGLGLEAPWKLVDQRLDINKQPPEWCLAIRVDRDANALATVVDGHGNDWGSGDTLLIFPCTFFDVRYCVPLSCP